jgi:Ser/Thr protein kinase RdoA (MazF antagonist)
MSTTTLTREQLASILKQYDAPIGDATIVSHAAIDGGIANSSFKVTLAPRQEAASHVTYCLKVCDQKTIESIEREIAAMLHMKQHRFRTCFAAQAANGKYFAVHNGTMPCLLLDYIQGAAGRVRDESETTRRSVRELGAALGQLHRLPVMAEMQGEADRWPTRSDATVPQVWPFNMGLAAIDAFLRDMRTHALAEHPFVVELRTNIARLTPLVTDVRLPRCLLHGDLYIDNAMFADDGALVAVVDLEEVCFDVAIVDVALGVMGAAFVDFDRFAPQLARDFLAAYAHERPFEPSEKELFAHVLDYCALGIAFWRFREFEVRSPHLTAKRSWQKAMEQRSALLEAWNSKAISI